MEPLQWLRCIEARFPHTVPVAKDVLAVQASSVASKSQMSWAENLIGDHRTSLADDIASECLCARYWKIGLGNRVWDKMSDDRSV